MLAHDSQVKGMSYGVDALETVRGVFVDLDAIAFGDKSADTVAALTGTTAFYFRHQTARIYIALGEQNKALDILEYLLKQPYYLTREWLKIDPNFAPLRGNPRFERMIAGAQVTN